MKDYSRNPSQISGSLVQVNENSPYLDEELKKDSWKRVIKGGVGEALDLVSKKDLVKKKKK